MHRKKMRDVRTFVRWCYASKFNRPNTSIFQGFFILFARPCARAVYFHASRAFRCIANKIRLGRTPFVLNETTTRMCAYCFVFVSFLFRTETNRVVTGAFRKSKTYRKYLTVVFAAFHVGLFDGSGFQEQLQDFLVGRQERAEINAGHLVAF